MENKDVKELAEKAIALAEKFEKTTQKVKELEEEKATAIASSALRVGNRSNSIEQKTLNAFGVSNVAELIQVNTQLPRFSIVPQEFKSHVRELKRAVDLSRMISQRFYEDGIGGSDDERTASCKTLLSHNYGRNVLAPMLKAYGSTTAGAGDEWVPTLVSASYIEEFELERKLAGQIKQIAMPSNPFELPVQNSVTTAKLVSEGATASAVNFGTTKITLNAKKLVEYHELPEELNEDSAPPIFDLIRDQLVWAQERAVETALINGDTTGTHQDSDVTAASDARKAWKGFRKLALANSANGSVVTFSSAITKAKLDEMRQAMGKFGVNPRQLMWILGPVGYNQAMTISEVETVEKFGPMATILQGALSAYRGIPIIVSEFVREDVNASGVYDGVTTDNTFALLVNKERFYLGKRRPIKVKIQPSLPASDQWLMASYQRVDFQGHAQSASEVSVVIGIDVSA